MTPYITPWSVIAAESIPSSFTRFTYSFILLEPSSRLYSVWTCRWVNAMIFSSVYEIWPITQERLSSPAHNIRERFRSPLLYQKLSYCKFFSLRWRFPGSNQPCVSSLGRSDHILWKTVEKRRHLARYFTSLVSAMFFSKRERVWIGYGRSCPDCWRRASPLQILLQRIHLIQFLPGQIQIISAEMSVSRRLFVNRTPQV